MKKQLITTCYRAVENAMGNIQLYDLYMEDSSHHNKPCLSFKRANFESVWDNSEYLLIRFLNGLQL